MPLITKRVDCRESPVKGLHDVVVVDAGSEELIARLAPPLHRIIPIEKVRVLCSELSIAPGNPRIVELREHFIYVEADDRRCPHRAPRGIGAPVASNSSWRRASARHATFTECDRPSVSI